MDSDPWGFSFRIVTKKQRSPSRPLTASMTGEFLAEVIAELFPRVTPYAYLRMEGPLRLRVPERPRLRGVLVRGSSELGSSGFLVRLTSRRPTQVKPEIV